MALNRTYISTAEKIETAILQHLRYEGDFRGCALVMHGLALESPERLPCVVIHCTNVSTHEGFPARRQIIPRHRQHHAVW